MKEPSAPQATYDGSLKELAGAHAGLTLSLMFLLLVPVSLFFFIVNFEKIVRLGSGFEVVYACMFFGSIGMAVIMICYHCFRVARLLFPHHAVVIGAAGFFPPISLMVAAFLWFSAIRQLRARGLHVGVLGIDPARVE
jgi:hypothetical protein